MAELKTPLLHRLAVSATVAAMAFCLAPHGAQAGVKVKVKAKVKVNTKKDKKPPPVAGRNTQVELDGYRTLLYTSLSMNGNAPGFRSQNGIYFSKTKLQQEGYLTLQGQLNEGVYVEGELAERAFDDPTFRLSVKAKDYVTRVGDFEQQFPTGPLLSFTKSMRGISVEGSAGPNWRLSGLFTKQKSKTDRQVFSGRGIRGPYQLGNISVVEGSETVRLNGVVLPPAAYDFDYFLGEITFRDPVLSTDQLEITYDSALFLSSHSSGLSGVAANYANTQGTVKGYLAGYTEGVNPLRADPVLTDARNFSAANLTAGALNLNTTRIRRGSVVLERIEAAGGFTLLVENTDWKMDYPRGVLSFVGAVAAGTNYQISFEYYDDSRVRRVLDEELTDNGQSTFVLRRSTIYSGTETVEVHQGGGLLQTLQPGVDYVIDEANNSLILLRNTVFPDTALDRVVRVDYEIVDTSSDNTGRGNRTAMSAGVQWAPVKGLMLGVDAASTRGDIAPKSVQITELTVGVADGVTTLFTLPQQPVLGSQEVYFDDTFSPTSRKSLGTDYTLEPGVAAGTGQIRFRVAPPVGTVILASYRYLPTRPVGAQKEDGQAWQVRASGDFWQSRLRFQGQYRGKDRAFSPNNQLNNLEDAYLDASVTVAVAKPLSLSLWRTQTQNHLDFSSSHTLDVTEDTAEVRYAQGPVQDFYLSTTRLSREAPVAAGRVDIERRKNALGLTLKPFGSAWTLNARGESTRQNDDTRATGDRDTRLWETGAAYDNGGPWRGTFRLLNNRYTADPAPGAPAGTRRLTFDTFSREFTTGYNKGIWSFNTVYDTQRQNDGRAGRDYNVENTTVNLTANPKGPVERVNLFLYRRDHPSGDLGNTRTTTATGSLTWRLASNWFFTPSYTSNTAAQGGAAGVLNTENDDQAGAALLEFRPQARAGFRARFSVSRGDRDSRSQQAGGAVVTSKGDTRQDLLRLDYTRGRYNGAISWDENRQGQNAGPDTRTRNRFVDQTLRLGHRFTLRALLNRQETLGAGGTQRDKAVMELHQRLSKTYEMKLSYEWQKSDTGVAVNDYDGHIARAELRANF